MNSIANTAGVFFIEDLSCSSNINNIKAWKCFHYFLSLCNDEQQYLIKVFGRFKGVTNKTGNIRWENCFAVGNRGFANQFSL
uniref:Uncharacterized protein n=1 Tax=Onchocerca volvulus TaxID=6282 RepID=A0A8R1XRE3_ONCVO